MSSNVPASGIPSTSCWLSACRRRFAEAVIVKKKFLNNATKYTARKRNERKTERKGKVRNKLSKYPKLRRAEDVALCASWLTRGNTAATLTTANNSLSNYELRN
jgi:hypothetical protein